MADVALSIPSSLAALLSSAAPADGAAAAATAQPADPFAALFASATAMPAITPALDPAATALAVPVASPATPAATAFAAPVAISAAPTAPIVTPNILASPAAPVPVPTPAIVPDAQGVVATIVPSAARDEPGKPDKSKKSDSDASSDDPLADAIASGATAVLAFAPAIAPVVVPVPQAHTPIAIDAPIVPRKLPAISVLPSPLPFKTVPLPITSDTPAPNMGQATPDQSGTAQTPVMQSVATDDTPMAAPLSPETLKAVIAALKQSDQPAAAAPIPDSVATPTTAPAAVADTAAKAPPPVVEAVAQAAIQETAPTPPVARRRGDEDIAAPRRAGSDTRKRIAPAAIETAPVGLAQRATERAPASDASTAIAAKGDTIVEQSLSIARDGAWLDTLARDIAHSAGNGNDLHFKLNPQNLGSLTVAIAQSDGGASIRLTADTETTRNILLDAQPKLVAEARAQGLKVAETHVDLREQHQSPNQDASRWTQGNGGQNGSAQNGQNRQSSPAHQPFVSNLGRKSDAESESPAGDSDALYA